MVWALLLPDFLAILAYYYTFLVCHFLLFGCNTPNLNIYPQSVAAVPISDCKQLSLTKHPFT
jgi:hypothetical protein